MILKPKLYIMTYRSDLYTWIYYSTHQYLLICFEFFFWNFLLNLILDWDLVILTRFFCDKFKIWKFIYGDFYRFLYYLFIEVIFWRIMFWTRKVSFWGETYLHLLNNRIFVERSFENLHCTNLSKLMQESIQILMNENNKSFYSSDMFEFIHHPKYGCCDLKGLNVYRRS
jgi:hypothetical protein